MSCFAVIYVDPDYYYVQGVACVAVRATEAEAKAVVADRKKVHDEMHRARLDYIDRFVDAIVVPAFANYAEFQRFMAYYDIPSPSATLDRFQQALKIQLRTGYTIKDSGYNPPPRPAPVHNLLVVEIPDVQILREAAGS